MSVMTVVLLLGLAWLVANAALVLILRRTARVREREPGHASRGSRPSARAMLRSLGRRRTRGAPVGRA